MFSINMYHFESDNFNNHHTNLDILKNLNECHAINIKPCTIQKTSAFITTTNERNNGMTLPIIEIYSVPYLKMHENNYSTPMFKDVELVASTNERIDEEPDSNLTYLDIDTNQIIHTKSKLLSNIFPVCLHEIDDYNIEFSTSPRDNDTFSHSLHPSFDPSEQSCMHEFLCTIKDHIINNSYCKNISTNKNPNLICYVKPKNRCKQKLSKNADNEKTIKQFEGKSKLKRLKPISTKLMVNSITNNAQNVGEYNKKNTYININEEQNINTQGDISNEFAQQNCLESQHKTNMGAKRAYTMQLFLKTFDAEQLRSFYLEFDKYSNDQSLSSEEIEKFDYLLKCNGNLNKDPFYRWKTFNTPTKDNMLFYYIQFQPNNYLDIMNRNENFTIQSLYCKEYIMRTPFFKDQRKKIDKIINYYNCMLIENSYIFDENNIESFIINKKNISDIFKEFFSDEITFNQSILLDFANTVTIYLKNNKIYENFFFDLLFRHANILAVQTMSRPCSMETFVLKKIMTKIFESAILDFHLFFPEIHALIHFMQGTNFFRSKCLHNQELYVYVFMLSVLTDIIQCELYKIYTINISKIKPDKEYDYILKQASSFSGLKFEICKIISYCLLPYITNETYENYAQIRILERFCLCAHKKIPFRNPNPKFDSLFYVSKFNFYVRFIFNPNNSSKLLFFNQADVPNEEKMMYCILNNHKISYFSEYIIRVSNFERFKKALNFFYNTHEKNPIYNGFYVFNNYICINVNNNLIPLNLIIKNYSQFIAEFKQNKTLDVEKQYIIDVVEAFFDFEKKHLLKGFYD
ncbi:hypothetical protein COBT_000492 [Conglomerata obtusa]